MAAEGDAGVEVVFPAYDARVGCTQADIACLFGATAL